MLNNFTHLKEPEAHHKLINNITDRQWKNLFNEYQNDIKVNNWHAESKDGQIFAIADYQVFRDRIQSFMRCELEGKIK